MSTTRREFVLVTATAAALAGCVGQQKPEPSTPATPASTVGDELDLGSASQFAASGVYEQFRDQGVIVVREGEKLFAISSECTHRGCIVHHESAGGFGCRCHGARFDHNGHVIKGPATRDLPRLSITTRADSHLIVRLPPST